MTKRVKRDDVVTKEVEVSTMHEPKFLTLTKKPANEIGFKIVRSDNNGEENEMADAKTAFANRKRRVRNAERSSLLYLEYPKDSTEEDVKRSVEEMGLEGYEIVKDEDGSIGVLRSDLTQIPEDVITVKLSGGIIAGVSRKDIPAPSVSDPTPHVAVVSLRFDPEQFPSEESISDYLQRNDIDIPETGLDNTDNVISVVLKRADENAEVREVEVDEGVIASVVRSEVWYVPAPYVEVVSETSYGQWGWGQYDFGAILADKEFSEAADRANYVLKSLLDRILFYSSLTIAARKDLVSRATEQYAAYINSLLDALPTKVIIANRSDKDTKESDMSKKEKTETGAENKTVDRSDEEKKNETSNEAPITRSEVATMIVEGVKAGIAEAVKEGSLIARSDESSEGNDAGGEADGEGKEEVTLKEVLRSVGELANSMKTLTEKVSEIEGGTIVRSDEGDGESEKKETQRKDPFKGMFNKSRNTAS
jgi:hypothetical protein